MASKMNIIFAIAFFAQIFSSAWSKPLGGCGCEGGFDGGFGGFGGFDRGCGDIGFRRDYDCVRPTPPISFLPVPQPVPIRVPQPPRQSVTIPNIILALLPPNQKPACAPRPVIRPPPVVLPLPQPFPCPVPDRCGC